MLDQLRTLTKGKNSAKAVIATYLLDHLNQLESYTMDDLAQATYTSKASLVRFAQGLGYRGWKDFYPALIKAHYYEAAHYSDVDHNLPFDQKDDTATIIQKLATIEKEAIQDTADRLDAALLERAAQALEKAHRIVIFGLTPNHYLAQVFKRKMLTIGKVIEVPPVDEMGLVSKSLRTHDLAIIISYSGQDSTSNALRHIPDLKARKIGLIGLTSQQGELIRSQIEMTFTITTRETAFRKIGNFSTEESILFLLNSLYAAYFARNYLHNYIYKIKNLSEIEGGHRDI